MNRLGKRLGSLLAWPLIALVSVYRYAVSPLLGTHCRFRPSCSVYAREALLRYGAFRGSWLAARRVARCHPWGGSGHDPLPGEQERRDGR
jgi:putative membrane protein insertion efficiency factor